VNIRLFIAGKPALDYAKSGAAEYLKRLGRYGSYEVVHLKAGDAESVSAALLKRSEGHYRIALDERGRDLGTAAWAAKFDALELDGGIKNVAFLIGAADGHTDALRARADEVWRLSALTLQHELALVVLLEQLYRVATLRRGEPYHR
jgi:23S rRNA (pseudouridine1915-N3)-methyltransferase